MARHLAPQENWETFIAQIDVSGKDVADIGCGTGWFADSFLRSARSLTLLDGDAKILEKAKERWFRLPAANPNIQFLEANFVEAPLPPDAFDVIGMVKTY